MSPARAIRFSGRAIVTVLLVWMAASCVDAPRDYRGDAPPRFVDRPLPRPERPIVALALGSGGPRVYAQIGVLRAFDEADIPIDLIVGTSGGAIIGALYAAGYSGAEITEMALSRTPWSFLDLAISDYGYVRGDTLERFIREHVEDRRIEALKIPFAAIATHVESGTQEIFNRGDTATAVRASAAIPGVFFPVRIEGEHYVDGELVSPVPIRVARRLGAEIVIAVDVQARLEEAPLMPKYPTEWLVYGTLRRALIDAEVDDATIMVQPALDYLAGASEAYRRRAIELGYEAGVKAVAMIRERIEEGTAEKKQARWQSPTLLRTRPPVALAVDRR